MQDEKNINKLLYEQFMDYIAIERGLSANTALAYGDDLSRYLCFLKQKGLSVKDAEQRIIVGYLGRLKKDGMGIRSIARHITSIKVFYRFLRAENYIQIDPTLNLDTPKIWKKIPNCLSIQEVDSLINQPDIKENLGIRNRAMLEVLYAAGMRIS